MFKLGLASACETKGAVRLRHTLALKAYEHNFEAKAHRRAACLYLVLM